MTTLDTLGPAAPAVDEVADAALAMADFDAKSGDYAMALDWLGVATQHPELPAGNTSESAAWKTGSPAPVTSTSRYDAVAAAALTVIRRALIGGVRVTRQALE